jgi:hypothetical protein
VDGDESVDDDELLYRRIPEAWYDPVTGVVHDQAFAPHKTNDLTGLSLSRAKYKTIQQAAKGRAGKRYFVAILRARDVRSLGIVIEPRPLRDDPGHAEIPTLNADNRKQPRTLELQRALLGAAHAVEGPFGPS